MLNLIRVGLCRNTSMPSVANLNHGRILSISCNNNFLFNPRDKNWEHRKIKMSHILSGTSFKGLNPSVNLQMLSKSVSSNDASVHEKVWTIPNVLSGSRIILAPYISYLICQGEFKWALACFGYAGFTDLVRNS